MSHAAGSSKSFAALAVAAMLALAGACGDAPKKVHAVLLLLHLLAMQIARQSFFTYSKYACK